MVSFYYWYQDILVKYVSKVIILVSQQHWWDVLIEISQYEPTRIMSTVGNIYVTVVAAADLTGCETPTLSDHRSYSSCRGSRLLETLPLNCKSVLTWKSDHYLGWFFWGSSLLFSLGWNLKKKKNYYVYLILLELELRPPTSSPAGACNTQGCQFPSVNRQTDRKRDRQIDR